MDCDPVKWDINNETQEYIIVLFSRYKPNGFNQNINAGFSLSLNCCEHFNKITRQKLHTFWQLADNTQQWFFFSLM